VFPFFILLLERRIHFHSDSLSPFYFNTKAASEMKMKSPALTARAKGSNTLDYGQLSINFSSV